MSTARVSDMLSRVIRTIQVVKLTAVFIVRIISFTLIFIHIQFSQGN